MNNCGVIIKNAGIVNSILNKIASNNQCSFFIPAVPTTPDATTPAATTPAASTPDATTPAVTTPAATTPDATTPEVTTPTTVPTTTPTAQNDICDAGYHILAQNMCFK